MTSDIQVGDIITAYHKGYHRVTDITRRYGPRYSTNSSDGSEVATLVTYDRLLDVNGKQKKKEGSTV